MPQLSKELMEYHCLHGFSNDILNKFKQLRVAGEYQHGVNTLCTTACRTTGFAPSVRKTFVKLHELTMTQNEGNASIVKRLIRDSPPNADLTRSNPIVVSSDKKIIDGHHRWIAMKLLDNRRYIHAYVIDMPHEPAMILAWILSTGQHSI